MPHDLPFHSLTELSRLLAQGKTTSTEIVEACLAAIDARDTKLHAFVDVYRDDARAHARAADRERKAGNGRGPLEGLPIALKDLLEFKGHPTTAGSKSWIGRISDHTATVVERLLTAGMIPLGKTHMVEFAFGGWGRNQPMGAPWNPWDMTIHRVAGGSSSGSAVAVAAGLAPAAIGSDTGGSIRIPAGLCGLTGLKPTYGLVSLYGAVPLSFTLDSIGPLARTADDAALLTAAMAGGDPNDPATLTAPPFDLQAALSGEADLRGMRITVLAPSQFPPDIEPEIVTAFEAAVAVLRKLGTTIEVAPLPFDLARLTDGVGKIIASEAYAFHRAYIEDETLPFDPWVRKRTLSGKGISAADYIDELAARRRAMAKYAEWMRGRDALLSPSSPITATVLADVDEAKTPLAYFTRAVNYLGACAMSLPAGYSAQGLPIGVQLWGAPYGEVALIRIGRAFQQASDWHRRRPVL